MVPPANSTLAKGRCSGPLWDYDDFDNCHRQRYLEFYPLAALLALAIVWTLSSLVMKWFAKSGVDEQVDPSVTVFHPKDVPDENANIILRTRSIGDRLRLAAELLLNIAQTVLVVTLYRNPEFIAHYNEFAPWVPKLLLVITVYTLGLSIYRFIRAKQIEPLTASPFAQQAYIYSVLMVIFALNWFSQFGYSYSDFVSQLTTVSLSVAVLNWIILFSSPIGDRVPRLYSTRKGNSHNTIPSTEPTSSLFTIMSCGWCSEMISQARKKTLDSEDVLDLEENDHVYHFLRRAGLLPEKWSFFFKLLFTTKKQVALNLFFGCSASFLKLTPTLFIQKILQYLENPAIPKRVAWLYVVCLGLAYLIHTVCFNQSFYWGRKLSLGVRSLIVGSVYRKALYQRTAKGKAKSERKASKNGDNVSTSGSEDDEDEADDEEDDNRIFDPMNTGAVINLMSVDAIKVADFASYMHDLLSVPLLVILSIAFLYGILGWSALVSVATMVAVMPFNVILAKRLNDVQDQLMAVTDRRIEKTSELLEAIRIVKFYAWEKQFTDNVLKVRDEELHLLLWRYIYWVANAFLFFLIPILVVISSFWCFVRYQGGNLTTSIAFTALAIFNIISMPLNELGFIFTDFSSTIVSLRRIQQYLKAEETLKYEQLEYRDKTEAEEEIIGFEDASFTWGNGKRANAPGLQSDSRSSDDESFKLRDINVKFKIEDLNVIVGKTGSGKSSLLLALLGEMKKESGHVYLPDGNRRIAEVDKVTGLTNTVAYCPQEAWLVNDTIKNNILFAHPYNKKRYNDVLDACELRHDLDILENGDQTLIGDKGIALSGGQKQRVSLARAMYSNSRHLILDDCLSAVDSHTAEALYTNALNGPLAQNRTVILVSHNIALTIGKASHVVVMSNGRVVAQGTPAQVAQSGSLGEDELINRNAQSAAASRSQSSTDLAAMNLVGEEAPRTAQIGAPNEVIVSEEDVADAAIEEEYRATGSVPLKVYIDFFKQLASTKGIIVIALFSVAVPFFEYLQSWWVKLWAASMGNPHINGNLWGAIQFSVFPSMKLNSYFPTLGVYNAPDEQVLQKLRYYSIGYALIGTCTATTAVLREYTVFYGGLKASRKIYGKLLRSVVYAKTRFHDSTPSGRIINRFSKDMEVIDQEISGNLLWLMISLLDAVQVSLIVSYVTPMIVPLALVILYLFTLIGRSYLAAARELKRLESITRSPIFQQFGETLSGSVVIRAYGDTTRFLTTNWDLVDQTHRPYFWLWVSNRWLSFWCSILSLVMCVLAAVIIVASVDFIDPGMAGISLSMATYFGDATLWVVRQYSQCEVSMNSVERVNEYLVIEQEAPAIIPESRPPKNWPSKGNVEFKNLSLQYSPEMPMVIKNVSFEIPGGKKVGIVGRTGAGKSTIITALLRMLEPSTGTIVIDDVDITTIGLEDLRSGLSIIPQDPTLFKGTLRSNIDLFNEYSDDSILKALAHAHLVPEGTTAESAAEAVEQSANDSENVNPFYDLSYSVTAGGRNLSQGQRQLLCLARAILKEPKILLLDEATASIDYATDALIQQTIRDSFNHSTILTIAHRLRTIADYDLILVLEKGEVNQFGHPYDLLQNTEGTFYAMCAKSGELDTLIKLARMAKETHAE